jgi:hypothetical protein
LIVHASDLPYLSALNMPYSISVFGEEGGVEQSRMSSVGSSLAACSIALINPYNFLFAIFGHR